MTEGRLDLHDPRWERAAVGMGIGFVVFALIAFLFAPDYPKADASDNEVLRYFAENDTRVLWQAFMFGLAGICFLWFFGTVAGLLRRAEPVTAGRLPGIVLAAAATAAGLYSVGVASFTALASSTSETVEGRPLFDLGNMLFTLTNFPAATLVAAVGLGVLRTDFLPDWLAWLGGAYLALGLIDAFGRTAGDSAIFGPGGAFGILTFLVFLAWVLATSVVLVQRTDPAAAKTEVTPPAEPQA
jgi:hypothetical protein